jgi:16S rRNA (cytosine967-C5)-methyltransferase
VALFQVLFMKKAFYHVVNETVEYVKKSHGKSVGNFVNAILRRAVNEKDNVPLPEGALDRMAIEHSFPAWMVRRWISRFGPEDTAKLLSLLNTEPEFGLRIDLNRVSRETISLRLQQKGVDTRNGALLPSALYVNKLSPVLSDRLFKEGFIRVQDESSQLVAVALGPQPDALILDAAAEPGTKTEHLLHLCPASRIVAMDLHVAKMRSLSPRALLVRGDAIRNPFKKEVFDSILVDAPCSSLGVIRKHPEIKWRRHEGDIARFSAYQTDMINGLWESLKPGGHLIYSVCSFEPEETIDVIERLKQHREFSVEPLPFLHLHTDLGRAKRAFEGEAPPALLVEGATRAPLMEEPLPSLSGEGVYLSLPHLSGSDGFFVAKLKKES